MKEETSTTGPAPDLQQRYAELQLEFRRYACHKPNCIIYVDGRRCSCGFEHARRSHLDDGVHQ